MTARQALLSGGCQCGAIRYALYAHPEGTHLCHCRMCQKAVGGPFAPLAPVRRKDFAWTRGTPSTFNSSSVAVRNFCGNCGTPLAFAYSSSDWIDVTIGSLDEPSKAPPRKHYGIEARVSWFHTIRRLPGERTEDSMDPDLQDQFGRLPASRPRHAGRLAAPP
ncbi:MAG TPA: GFA family protein [Rhodospirillales bacterium]|nr:GFA family protein [Rhodospirillales bacterium]